VEDDFSGITIIAVELVVIVGVNNVMVVTREVDDDFNDMTVAITKHIVA